MARSRRPSSRDPADAWSSPIKGSTKRRLFAVLHTSRINLPLDNPLDDAVEVARAIHDHVGVGECDDTQLSVWLDQSSKSSGYRMQLTAARMFEVLDPTSDTRKLTALGRMIVDPLQERAARADAFLKVPLYSAIYEKHKSRSIKLLSRRNRL